jgi:hypothetical protein
MGDRSARPRRDTSHRASAWDNSPLVARADSCPIARDRRVHVTYRGDDTIVRTSDQPNPTVSPTTSHDLPSTRTKKG